MRVLFLSEAPLIKYGIKSGFDQLGHVTDFMYNDPAIGMYRLWDKPPIEQISILSQKINEFRPDIIFSEGYAGMPIYGISQLCKQRSIPLMIYCVEDPVSTDWYSVVLAKYADYVFTTTMNCVPIYKKMGKPAELLMFACNPEFHKPVPSEDRFKHDISVVATNYSNRYHKTLWFLMSLIKNEYDVKVYGNNWWLDKERPINLIGLEKYYWTEPPTYVNGLPYEWLSNVVNSSKIMLGMNCVSEGDVGEDPYQCSMRPFETLACSESSVYLAHYSQAQNNIFGDLIYQAHNEDETIMMVNEILAMTDNQRKEKADKARMFVYENHTYKIRADQIIKAYNKI